MTLTRRLPAEPLPADALLADYGAAAEAVLTYVEQGRTDQAAGSLEVPVASYLDPARFELEMRRIFLTLPLLLGLSVELPNAGDYKTLDACGKPVLIVRGKDGVARAFLNACTHRGAPVADGRGHCPGRLTCQYHGWTFASDGRLLAVADAAKYGPLDKATRGLKALPCQEFAGMIFVALTPGAPLDIAAWLGGMGDELAAAGLERWHYVGTEEIHGANWKIAYDGYLEGYHFAVAHPDTIAPRTVSNVMHYRAHGPHLRTTYPTLAVGALRDLPRARWGTQENRAYDCVRTLFPNVSIFLAPEIAQIACLLPGPTPDRNRTILTYLSATPPADAEAAAATEAMKSFFRDVTDHEDYALGMKVQKGLQSGAIDSAVFGRNERGNQYFHRWVDWHVAGDPRAPTPEL